MQATNLIFTLDVVQHQTSWFVITTEEGTTLESVIVRPVSGFFEGLPTSVISKRIGWLVLLLRQSFWLSNETVKLT